MNSLLIHSELKRTHPEVIKKVLKSFPQKFNPREIESLTEDFDSNELLLKTDKKKQIQFLYRGETLYDGKKIDSLLKAIEECLLELSQEKFLGKIQRDHAWIGQIIKTVKRDWEVSQILLGASEVYSIHQIFSQATPGDDLVGLLEKSLSDLFGEIQINREENPLELMDHQEKCLVLLLSQKESLRIIGLPTELSKKEGQNFIFCLCYFNFYHHFHSSLLNAPIEGDNLREVFHHIPLPIALFDEDFTLLMGNRSFLEMQIHPQKIAKWPKEGIVEINHQSYSSLFRSFQKRILLTLIPQSFQDRERLTSREDLGVVTSSLAHELNNPIAGILSGIDLLELSANHENLVVLKEMKTSMRRCRDLIQTFLGFGRANPWEDLAPIEKELLITRAYDQAGNLLRFRMLEGSLYLEMEMQTRAVFHRPLNSSVLAMFFYVFCSEILTSCSHRNLVSGQTSSRIKVCLVENQWELLLQFDGDLIEEKFMENVLIKNLLDFLALKWSFLSPSELLLFDQPKNQKFH